MNSFLNQKYLKKQEKQGKRKIQMTMRIWNCTGSTPQIINIIINISVRQFVQLAFYEKITGDRKCETDENNRNQIVGSKNHHAYKYADYFKKEPSNYQVDFPGKRLQPFLFSDLSNFPGKENKCN